MRALILSLAVLLMSCTAHRSPVKPLDRKTFAAVYADMEATLWALKRTTGDTLVLSRAADSVLAAHGVTRDSYRATVDLYNRDLMSWKGFYDEVGKQLEDRAKQIQPADPRTARPPGG